MKKHWVFQNGLALGVSAISTSLVVLTLTNNLAHAQSPGVFIDQTGIERLGEGRTVEDSGLPPEPALGLTTLGKSPLLYPPGEKPRSQLISRQALELLKAELEAERVENAGQLPYSQTLLTSLGLAPEPGLELTTTPALPAIESAPEAVGLVDPADDASASTVVESSTPDTAVAAKEPETAIEPTDSLQEGKDSSALEEAVTEPGKSENKNKDSNKTNKKQKNTQVAVVPEKDLDDKIATVTFATESTELSQKDKEVLTGLAQRLNDSPEIRLQLLAYAADGEESSNNARRLSLSRALVVRKYLTDQGIAANRLQVRALGDQSIEGEPDRVDILPQGG
ncbi:MAG: OmpA family protein [Pseudomonadota bacterium]